MTMGAKAITIPGEVLDEIFEYVSETGEPMLHAGRETDSAHVADVSAWRQQDGSYELVDTELNNFLCCCDGWEHLAEYLGIDVLTIGEILERSGYPWDVPSAEVESEYWYPLEPFEAAAYLSREVPICQVQRLRSLIPRIVRWDRTTKYPEIPRSVQAALEWLGGNGAITVHNECWEMRGGSPESFVSVPSAVALSCLQVVLNEVGAGINLCVEG
jgi:hypothetical protein